MSEQNIIPSVPPLYPSLRENVGDYRITKISDCQKELENEISHNRRISKKCKRAKTIINAFAAATGALTVVLSTASLATLLSGIGTLAGVPIAGWDYFQLPLVLAAKDSIQKSQNTKKPFLSLNLSIFPSADWFPRR